METVGRWIHAAVIRKIKLLDLMFCPSEGEDIELPHCLVTCDSLEVLRLCLLRLCLNLPKVTGFPALRVLELNDVELHLLYNRDLVKYFLESCPLLEDLSLIDCVAYEIVISSPKLKSLRVHNRDPDDDDDDEDEDAHNYLKDWRMCLSLQISCPKLVFLKLTGYVALDMQLESLHSLKEAVIHTDDLFLYEDPLYYFFDELSHVESLSINTDWIHRCYNPQIDDPISLPNLKTLELKVTNLYMIIPFLTCLPDLESLHLSFPKGVYGLEQWKVDEGETLTILTRHLKKVEFVEFDGGKPELVVACALLEHGNEMEEMVFKWGNVERFLERGMETTKELLQFHMASKTVKLITLLDK